MQIALCSCSGNYSGQARPGRTLNLRGIHEEEQAGNDDVGSTHTRPSRHSPLPLCITIPCVQLKNKKFF